MYINGKIIMIVHYMHVKVMYLNIVNNLLIYKVIKFYKAFYFVVWYKQISLMRLSIIRIFDLAKPLQKISSKNVSEMSRSALTYISYTVHVPLYFSKDYLNNIVHYINMFIKGDF